MEPTRDLVDKLFRERIIRARQQTPGEKLFVGIHLFARVKQRMCDGIRDQVPDGDDRRVKQILEHRLQIARRLEEVQ